MPLGGRMRRDFRPKISFVRKLTSITPLNFEVRNDRYVLYAMFFTKNRNDFLYRATPIFLIASQFRRSPQDGNDTDADAIYPLVCVLLMFSAV